MTEVWEALSVAGGSLALSFIIAIALGICALTVLFFGSAVVVLEPADLAGEQAPEVFGLAGRALRRALRIYDFAAQYDDARFVALLPGADREGARAAGRRLLAELRSASMPQIRWRGALVTYPEDGATPNELLDRALVTRS